MRHLNIFVFFLLSVGGFLFGSSVVDAKPAKKDRLQNKKYKKPSLREEKGRFVLIAKDDDDFILPRIEPVAPLPKVFRKVKLTSQPSGVKVQVKKGNKVFPCLPANRTPCVVEISSYQKRLTVDIVVWYKKQVIRYRRTLKGQNIALNGWLLKMPVVHRAPPVFRMSRRLPPKRHMSPSKAHKGIPTFVWVITGVLLVGGIGAGVGIVWYSNSQIGFRFGGAGL